MTFAHIPVHGFEISRARLVEIRDSVFSRVSPRSVVVERTKEVYVTYNEMTINALEAVYATDGSHLFISCNRILNRPISPECSRTTTTTTTTTTSTTTTTPTPIMDLDAPLGSKGRHDESEKSDSGISGEMIGGIVIGVLVVVALVLIFVLFNRRRQLQKPVDSTTPEEKPEKTTTTVTSTSAETGPAEEKEALLAVEEKDVVGEPSVPDEIEEVDIRPKFASPIWIDEIQKNKIFNRQKSLLSEESIKDLSNESHLKQVDEEPASESAFTPPPPPPELPTEVDENVVASEPTEETPEPENSNTESDEDRDINGSVQPEPEHVQDETIESPTKSKIVETDI